MGAGIEQLQRDTLRIHSRASQFDPIVITIPVSERAELIQHSSYKQRFNCNEEPYESTHFRFLLYSV